MTTNRLDSELPNTDIEPLEEPLAQLERQLIAEYLAPFGQNLHTLLSRNDHQARSLLADASRYAAGRLTEVESRSDYLRHLRGQA